MGSLYWHRIALLVCVAVGSLSTQPLDLQKRDNTIQEVVFFALINYNEISPDLYLYKVVKFQSKEIQVMMGAEYLIDAEMVRTQCLKAEYANPNDCPVMITDGQSKTQSCHFVVLVWRDIKVPVQSICKDT
ncbi:CYTC protein, partial [Amia calva]|nr:CYTC protein [Amia calva]